MLITSAGRTFCVMPKSTCDTSPRSGTRGALLFLVERSKHVRRQRSEVVVGQIFRHWDTFDDGSAQLDALRRRKFFDLGENVSNGLRHGTSLTVRDFAARVRRGRH